MTVRKPSETIICVGDAKSKTRSLLLGAVSVIAWAALMTPAHAQTADDEPEEIVVIGLRQSLADAINDKRRADEIVDAIRAEDIGKTTDQNIAEALSRITGVSLQSQDGEGTTVSVRGVSADLNNITLNGVPLTSSGDNQAVNLSEFSADVLNAIEVVKTAAADQNEGSLGASINLKGFRPLDARRDRASIEFQGRYNGFATGDLVNLRDLDNNYKINGAFSKKFFDDKVGLSLIASRELQETRTDLIDYQRHTVASPSNGAINAVTGEAVGAPLDLHAPRLARYNYEPGNRDRDTISATLQFKPSDTLDIQFDYTNSKQLTGKDANRIQANGNQGNGVQGNVEFDPTSLTITRNIVNRIGVSTITRNNFEQVQKNDVFAARITKQAGPFEFELRGGTSQTTSRDNFFKSGAFNLLRDGTNRTGFNCLEDTGYELCSIQLEDSNGVSLNNPERFRLQRINERRRNFDDKASSLFFDADWDIELGPITSLEAGAKYTTRNKLTNITADGFNRSQIGIGAPTLNLYDSGDRTVSDFGGELGLPRDEITAGFPILDLDALLDFIGRTEQVVDPLRNYEVTEDTKAVYLKANYDLMDSQISGNFGVRFVDTEIESSGSSGIDYISVTNQSLAATPEYSGGVNDEGDTIVGLFASEAEALVFLGADTSSGDANAFAAVGANSYTNVLPSFNLNWAASDDVILRFAASQTMARPRIEDLNGGIRLIEDSFRFAGRGTGGNPDLDPYLSTNLDVSAEWYFKKNSLLSVALFDKNLQDFAEKTTSLNHYRDIRDRFYDATGAVIATEDLVGTLTAGDILLPYDANAQPAGCMPSRQSATTISTSPDGCDIVSVEQPRNGSGGYVRGAEIALQHNFTEWPGIFGGLGFQANYTYADSRSDEEAGIDTDGNPTLLFVESPLLQTSEHTFNGTVFYEQNGKLLRLAYNTRSDYLVNRSAEEGYSVWQEGTDSLDLSAGWDFNKNVSLSFQAVNLLDTVRRRYSVYSRSSTSLPAEPATFDTPNTNRTVNLQNTGTIYRMGIRYNF